MEEKKQRKFGSNTQHIELGYKCEYGTVNKNSCTAIYFGVNTYVHPNNDYKSDVDRFKWNFERKMNPLIKSQFRDLVSGVIYSIEDRITNEGNRTNNRFTLLPIEVTILFNKEIDYNEAKDEILILIRLMVKYLFSYQELVFDSKLYK
jgi:hypothetical protein